MITFKKQIDFTHQIVLKHWKHRNSTRKSLASFNKEKRDFFKNQGKKHI